MPLPEQRRQQLDGIVQQMIQNKETDDDIQFVVDDFVGKYSAESQPIQPVQKDLLGKAAGIGEKILGFTGGKNIAEIGGSLLAGQSLPQALKTQGGTIGKGILKTAGDVGQIATEFAPVGRATKLLGKVATGAGLGYAFDISRKAQEGKVDLKPGIGTAIGTAVPLAGELGKLAKQNLPKLLSYTSDVPDKAFEVMIQRRQPVAQALKTKVSGEQALKETQGAVRQLRTTLSQEWDDATKNIYQEFAQNRWGMGDNAVKLANKVSDDFGIALPQDVKNMSVKESLDLLKEVNELYSKRIVRESAQGIGVRKFKDFLQTSVIKNFGGDKGSVAQLYKNYSAKKGVFDAANDIVRAYQTGKPITQSTALGRIKALFNENKTAYIDAIMDLEKATGKDLLSKIASIQFKGVLPSKMASVSSSGGLQAPKGVVDKALDLMIFPLTSPRMAGFIARNVSKIKAPPLPGNIITSLLKK